MREEVSLKCQEIPCKQQIAPLIKFILDMIFVFSLASNIGRQRIRPIIDIGYSLVVGVGWLLLVRCQW